MAKTDKEGNWIDARGHRVPPDLIPELDRERDALVEKLIAKGKKCEAWLINYRKECTELVDAYLAELAKSKKVKESWRGNIQLKSYDESQYIQRAMSDRMEFNENLQLAKAQIDVWLKNRMGGSDPAIEKIISQAFNVDKKRCVNTSLILRLLHLEIDDKDWVKAMTLLKESMVVASTKLYFRFYEKTQTKAGEDWRQISLDFANAGD
jgi:hypothetical protein